MKFDPLQSGRGQPTPQGGARVEKFEKITLKMKSAPSNYYKCKFSGKSDKVEIFTPLKLGVATLFGW